MPLPPIPPPLEHLASRPFSFYPPILNIEHNEWRFRRATWSEILVANTASGAELWIPRRFVGEISRIEDPVVIVGLVKELEYKGGAVWPYQRKVLEMPLAVNDAPRPPASGGSEPAPVIRIRVESGPDSRIVRLIGAALLVGVLSTIAGVTVYRSGILRPRIHYTTRDQSYLELVRQDDYYDVVRKLGEPAQDRWQTESGEIQYRALVYTQRAYIVILMGDNRREATYIGTLDANWKPVHWVTLRGGGATRAILSGLGRF
ncbi:MAG: hypothetical protein FJW37_12390 [Acidobacteria bacterium]|nr:hypothetical protein [Acidobacteriota bacterium]